MFEELIGFNRHIAANEIGSINNIKNVETLVLLGDEMGVVCSD